MLLCNYLCATATMILTVVSEEPKGIIESLITPKAIADFGALIIIAVLFFYGVSRLFEVYIGIIKDLLKAALEKTEFPKDAINKMNESINTMNQLMMKHNTASIDLLNKLMVKTTQDQITREDTTKFLFEIADKINAMMIDHSSVSAKEFAILDTMKNSCGARANRDSFIELAIKEGVITREEANLLIDKQEGTVTQ